ncbi:hypothetical protein [Acidianus ambivalens]|uniref:Uncharacterized protein n=1 Tax=Acidianus ambivalens TaxID=2283 RepID=A0A650CTE0_ACIAM|nr:hypothetical protein [Acidianus ambivalens]MQL56431.1 hypothetical protein [Acidianus ambivalens]QGR21068.1 hypothetical protein D1866_02805 [Acidianus ambivalens]
MKKWILSFLILLLVMPAIPVNAYYEIIGGGGGPPWSPFTITKTISTTGFVTKLGCTLSTANWWSTVTKCGTNLKVLSGGEYTGNNVSISLSTSSIYFNVTFYLNGGTSPYGEIAIAYGTYVDINTEGNYGLNTGSFGNAGIIVALEHGAMKCEHIFAYFNGQVFLNATVPSLTAPEYVTLAFNYTTPYYLHIYVTIGSCPTKVFCVITGTKTTTGINPLTLEKLNNDFQIQAWDGGTVFGQGVWCIVRYSFIESVTCKISLTYESLVLCGGIHALYGYAFANNPINVSTSASWSITSLSFVNYSISGAEYPAQGKICYSQTTNKIYLIPKLYPAPATNSWYLNITITLRIIILSKTFCCPVVIPIFVGWWACSVTVYPPCSSYLSGQTISVTNITGPNIPTVLMDAGYSVAVKPTIEIDIEGLTNGFVDLPYTITEQVCAPTSYNYIIRISEGCLVEGEFTGSFTIYPATKQPVIFVSPYPTTVTEGQTITLTFQFSYNTPIENVSMSAFVNKGSNFAFSYAKDVVSKALIEFCGYWASANDGLLIITMKCNYLIPFNGSSGLQYNNDTLNELQLTVTATNEIDIINVKYGTGVIISNSSPILGIGFYYGAGALNIKWFFVDGIILQSATADQSFVILTGTSTTTLSQYITGYTNSTGFGQFKVTLTDTPYELVEVDWYGVTYKILNISVTQSTTTTTSTTTVCTSTLNYNYTQPFSNNVQPNSSLYNFSSDQPWASLIGITVTVIVALLGWKFGGKAGASGGAVMGLIMTSYLGLMPWYIFYIFVFGVALLLAKTFTDRFMGGEE